MVTESTTYSGQAYPVGYDYDSRGRLVEITRNASIDEHTVYIYAGPNCIAEYPAGTAAASPTQEYVYAGSASGGCFD